MLIAGQAKYCGKNPKNREIIMNEYIKPKVTRENLNSFDHSFEDVFYYLSDLIDQEQEPTMLEVFAMGYLCTINPGFAEKFKQGVISKTERKTFPPEFSEAMELYKAMLDQNDGEDTDESIEQFVKAMRLAPKWFNDMAFDKASEMGLIPNFNHCLADGTPVISSKEMADHLGISEEEVLEMAQKSQTNLETADFINQQDPEIYKIQ